MMEAACESLVQNSSRPILIAVTVLTSMGGEDLHEIGITASPAEQVLRLATLTKSAGLDGVVCSAQETSILTSALGKDFCLVTPGIRPAGSELSDQKRVMTPADAITAGSHYLVIGRPITQSTNPIETLNSINSQIS